MTEFGSHYLGLLLLLTLPASPLLAEVTSGPAAVKAWGMGPLSRVTLAPADGHPADVVFSNQMTWGHPMDLWFELDLGELAVDIMVRHGNGSAADLLIVEPPPGYAAYPPTLPVEDNQEGRIAILPIGWS